jgi:asparagine synthase (glutamine-hydrolysing)
MWQIFGVNFPTAQLVTEDLIHVMMNGSKRWTDHIPTVRFSGRSVMACQVHNDSVLSVDSGMAPVADSFGNVVVLDGRLDNVAALQQELGLRGDRLSDAKIVLEAFRKWGQECFGRFVGDWAVAISSDGGTALYLGRDHAGTRTLFFREHNGFVYWATHLECLLSVGLPISLNEAYAARFLSGLVIGDLTPYREIQSVPPAHFLRFEASQISRRPHWSALATDQIYYGNPRDYQERFLTLFKQSVARRTNDGIALAQLSGGMDSSSIVCISDLISHDRSNEGFVRVGTMSFFDDTEPTWNERPYFEAVEQMRAQRGFHLDGAFSGSPLAIAQEKLGNFAIPGRDGFLVAQEEMIEEVMTSSRCGAILSGIGGDELLGGVPSPFPELADYLFTLEISRFWRSSMKWALARRCTVFELIEGTLSFLNSTLRSANRTCKDIPRWLAPRLRVACREVATGREFVQQLYSSRPSSMNQARVWWHFIDSLPHLQGEILRRYEYRYPYLDRDLVEFLLRVPRCELVQPGRRRAMMRSALVGVVPEIVLERRRKAYLLRRPIQLLQDGADDFLNLLTSSRAVELGWIDGRLIREEMEKVRQGDIPPDWPSLMRAARLELWLRGLDHPETSDRRCSYQAKTFDARTPGATRLYVTTEPS